MSRLRQRLTDRLTLSVVGLVAALALCTTYLFSSVLEVPLTGSPDRVTVELERTGGLFEGSPVTYRGVRVGTVETIGISAAGRAEATITLRPGTEVPRDTRAAVRSLSPVGEQYLDLQPEDEAGPFLADGDTISAGAVDLPVSLAEAVDGVDSLLTQVDERDVRVVLRELSLALDGSGEDLDSLIRSLDEVSTTLDEAYPETARLLRNGEVVGELVEANNGRLRTLSRRALVLTAWLADYDPEFRRILRRAPGDLDIVDRGVRDLAEVLPPFLGALYETADLLWKREPHLRELARTLEYGAGRFADAFSDGWLNVDILFQGQEKCEYGSPEHPPQQATEEFNQDGRCAPDDRVWRGGEHAPPPLDR